MQKRFCKVLSGSLLGLWILGFHPPFLFAQETQESSSGVLQLSMDQALEMGLSTYEKIKISQTDIRAAKGQEWQSYSFVLPNIQGSYEYARNLKKPSIFFETGKVTTGFDNVHQFELDVVQPLTRFGGLYQGVKAGRKAYQASVFADVQNRADVIFQIRQAYYNVLLSRAQLKVAKLSLDIASQIRHREELRLNVGEIPEFDYNRATLEEDNKQAQLTQAEGNYQIAIKTLQRIISVDSNREIELTDSLDKFSLPILEKQAREQFESSNPTVKSLTKTAESQEASRRAQQSALFPFLSFFSTYQAVGQTSTSFFPSGNDFFNAWQVGFSLEVPVFDGMLTWGKYKTAEANASKAAWEKQLAEKDLQLALDQALIQAKTSLSKKETDYKSVKLAETLFHQATLRFQNGLLSYIDLKDVENQLEAARLRYLDSLYDYVLGLAKIEQVVGSAISNE